MMVASDSLIWQPRRVTITNTATRRNKPGKLPAAQLPGRPCSIARSLDLLGEKWALLAVREVSFGNHRFNEIARNTGAPRDRLAARLRALAPVLRALLAWGDRWVSPEPPATLRHGDHDLDLDWVCRRCGQAPDEGSVTVH